MWIDEKWTKKFDKMWKNEIGFYQIGVNRLKYMLHFVHLAFGGQVYSN